MIFRGNLISVKSILVSLVLFFTIGLSADDLKINVEGLNFFAQDGRTIIDVNYSIKYNNLTFKTNAKDNGAIAGLRWDCLLLKEGKVVFQDGYTNKIIVTSKKDIESKTKEFEDRYSFDYAKEGYTIKMVFTDLVSKDSYIFEKELPHISKNRYISDIELDDFITKTKDETYKYMYRGDILYKSNASHVFYQELSDSLYCYFQLRDLQKISKYEYGYSYNIRLSDANHTTIFSKDVEGSSKKAIADVVAAINIQDLSKGMFYVEITNGEQLENNVAKTDFSISDFIGETIEIFGDYAKDYKLMKFFGYGVSSKTWENITPNKKRIEISNFWIRYSNANKMSIGDFTNLIKERITYCNNKFSHHKDGWSSDRGMVYLIYGEPDDIQKYVVGDADATDQADIDSHVNRRVVLNDREYEIWRYTSRRHASYTFFDINMDNSHKLIYVYNDPDVHARGDWKFYLGQDFNEDVLK